MMEPSNIALVATVAAGILATVHYFISRSTKRNRPPAVKEDWWFQNTMRYVKHPPNFIRECITRYGNIFSLSLGGNHFVLINAGGEGMKKTMDEFWKTDFRTAAGRSLRIELFMPNSQKMVERSLHAQMLRTSFQATLDQQSVKIGHVFRKQIAITTKESLVINDPRDFAYTMIANASAECFLGTEMASQPAVISFFKTFNDSVNKAGLQLFLPFWSFRFLSPFLPYRRHHAEFVKLISPFLEKRAKMNPEDVPNDGISQLTKLTNSPEELVSMVMLLVLASMITTANALHNMLYDLANHPECATAIREEMENVAVEESVYTKKQFGEMPFLDAFVRESLIHTSPSAVSIRYMQQDFVTESGIVIPKGSNVLILGVDSHAIENNAEGVPVFNPSRWLPTSKETTQKFCTTTGSDFVVFGVGPYKCPGRFFSTLELKSCITTILSRYDLAFADGRKEHTARSFVKSHPIPAYDENGNQVALLLVERK